MNFLDKYSDYTYAIFRIVIAFMFLCHGTQKFFSFPIAFPYPLNTMTIGAGIIEIVAGILIIIGFYSRFAAFISSGTMAVAYWMHHGLEGVFPIANGGELSVFYCFAFLYIATKGPGIWSINEK